MVIILSTLYTTVNVPISATTTLLTVLYPTVSFATALI